MFVAVVADRDGNEFVGQARDAGAAFALISRGRSIQGMTCVEVDDTTVALAQLGRHYREKLATSVDGRVVGITGSAGKTSTKNLVRAVLSQDFIRVHAAAHSLNNDIGVPVTILNAPEDSDALVIEMGMRGFHEIERLCVIASPTIGVITNIGDAHGERVGGASGIAQAKGELVESLPSHGTAILNADDEWLSVLSARAACRVLTFGTSSSSDLVWSVVSVDDFGVVTARFDFEGESAVVTPLLAGVHMISNAAAAVLVGVACGMKFSDACVGIGQEQQEFGRMVWITNESGQRILDDTYNANESSMIAALRVLASAGGERKVAVLGQMAEVTDAVTAHRNVAEFAMRAGIEIVALETDLYGLSSQSLQEVLDRLDKQSWNSLLVKGSRSAATERVVQALLK
jgi:UDP-N-acetylmuramoyl-tripeptide--D-alanyl-D-alanine ligase